MLGKGFGKLHLGLALMWYIDRKAQQQVRQRITELALAAFRLVELVGVFLAADADCGDVGVDPLDGFQAVRGKAFGTGYDWHTRIFS